MSALRRTVVGMLLAGSAFAAVTLLPASAAAQDVAGRITGRVTDEATKQPMSGITVIAQGDQFEDATLTDDQGVYTFTNLAVGTYTVHFYTANSATQVERGGLKVSAGATVRADAAIPSQAAPEQTYVIAKKAAAVDVGSERIGLTIDEGYTRNVPVGNDYGDVLNKAPGVFEDQTGGVSIAGASGLENTYVMDGLNVTGLEYGDIMNRHKDAAGGSNLTLEFVKELQINSGGYRAEFGGSMGGVINVITKSGTNEHHGTAFSYWAPYWLAGDARRVSQQASSLSGLEKPDRDQIVGFEVGGPILKNRLFYWVGFAPRFERSHFFRDVNAFQDDGMGGFVNDANGNPVTTLVQRDRINQHRYSYQMGVKLDFLPLPNHHLTLGFFNTPYSARHVNINGRATGIDAVNDVQYMQEQLDKTNTDLTANWVSQLFDNRWRIEANLGMHRESYSRNSPFSALQNANQIEWWGANLYDLEGIAGCNPANGYSCPVDNYHNGGFGETKKFTGYRWLAEVKSTNTFLKNELKYGARLEYVTFDQSRWDSGTDGDRALVQHYPDNTLVWSFFTLPPNRYASQFLDDPSPLAQAPYYQDRLVANVSSLNTAYFLQDTYHLLPNLMLDAGVRYENQRMYDFRDQQFLNVNNVGPRVGLVYDPSNEGRSKVFANFGQFYETVPMNLAARYFGGEGLAIQAFDSTACQPAGGWPGTSGGWRTCDSLGTFTANNGAPYPVQPNIRGQYHNEVVAGFRHALTDDLVVGLDYTHRWLGAIIEDGAATGDFVFVLGNPGNVPQSAIDDVEKQVAQKQAEVDALQDGDPQKVIAQGQLGDLNIKLGNLKAMKDEPKPERTYDAITLSASKRLARNWMVQASYTYSRLIGNYNGLYDADNNYFAPNGGNAYDTPDLVLNKRGPLANDRPHSGRVDGFYTVPVGKGSIVAGLSFSAYSGVPRNYQAALIPGYQLVFLLPRGSAGRTPTVTQTDLKLVYHREISKTLSVEAFLDLFNIMNQRTALLMDDNYTYDTAAAIVNGDSNDLKYAKNSAGAPVSVNPNFGQPTVYQRPFNGRMGVRVLF